MNSTIRICFIVSSLCNEGPVNVMYNIIQYMDFSKFEVSIITLIPEKENTRINDFRKLPIAIYQITDEHAVGIRKMFNTLKAMVIKIDPHIIHTHCPRSLYLSYFLPKKYKCAYTIHIYPGLQQEILYGKLKGCIVNMLNHYFTHRVDLPIACADSISELYKKNKHREIMSIPNGCSLPVWENNNEQKKVIRNNLGLKDNIKYFIFIGRFSFEKNPQILVEAFHQLKDPEIGLIMLGNGPLWEDLRKYENENIVFPGFKTNVYDYLIASDYYISASDVEGLANTLLESMTIGLPLLLSDIPSHNEILSKMNQTVGFIFDNKNPEDLKIKINKIIQSVDINSASSEIKCIFEKLYTAKKMSQSYQTAYSRLYLKKSN
ncbi:glycosyltransferase [Parabacteroides gordonii]|uniref:Glycosyl transferase family 1 domain-containing protein n=1 Tax=Parabacteroides gordonii MS-1 = DSM 23371 TaxID=1203610 RepID=A0A0F5JTA8_9BACT|nr:glycosyltransferase [Parabacteroides gordonii]KKB60612.1 hypothetical protein HMPREF1536_00493 [Parabacteroides gordonii MS-1 = DSM 23371]MCA5586254.1 glycosyltransferase [Parabacteroides gordonii]